MLANRSHVGILKPIAKDANAVGPVGFEFTTKRISAVFQLGYCCSPPNAAFIDSATSGWQAGQQRAPWVARLR